MQADNQIRPGELAADWSGADADVVFIGRIHTPWSELADCPRHGRADGPLCRIEIFETWGPALAGLDEGALLEVFYWLHRSRRDLLQQCPRNDGVPHGTFSIRSPIRPNPIGTSVVRLESRDGNNLFVRGLDCLNGTPLVDLKPDRKVFVPLAPPKPGDFLVGDA
ncbi:tRNA (N6-threonylcarbamoyladenosine(37)-N6)-methyltransferase TrmO [Rhodopseudomonas palustris]|uniref:TsaA-like domain-containing protein n=1 Tax=Rhodopseudomonas palustris (strain BisB18) TaxID=316056 RepID=Q216Z5_RHOPB